MTKKPWSTLKWYTATKVILPLQGEEHTTAYHDEVSNRIAVQLTFMQSFRIQL